MVEEKVGQEYQAVDRRIGGFKWKRERNGESVSNNPGKIYGHVKKPKL